MRNETVYMTITAAKRRSANSWGCEACICAYSYGGSEVRMAELVLGTHTHTHTHTFAHTHICTYTYEREAELKVT